METNVGLTLPDLSNKTWAARDDCQNLSVESKAIKMVKCRSNADVRVGDTTKNGEKKAPLDSIQNAHDDSIWTATWIPSTEESLALLLTGGLDETVRLCDPKNFTCIQTFTGHCLGIVSVAAHPTRRIAASTSIDSFIRVFEVDTNNTIATLEAPPSEVWQLQFSPNMRTIRWQMLSDLL
uniref:WD repeat-containing protein VIP3-like n=1 Tax=Nicotiana tabacum TaxID=4097 RepID=A0A1S3YQ32_TOBAC|nr:PREDICTED: WD repeat-containing protein VIP3-like [Nicotiana tabacum]